MNDEKHIDFIVEVRSDDNLESNQSKGVRRARKDSEATMEVRSIPIEAIKGNLKKVANAATTFLSDVRSVGDFELEEVELQVEVSAEGGINFVGTAKAGGKGAISLKFSRPNNKTKNNEDK